MTSQISPALGEGNGGIDKVGHLCDIVKAGFGTCAYPQWVVAGKSIERASLTDIFVYKCVFGSASPGSLVVQVRDKGRTVCHDIDIVNWNVDQ